MCPACFGQGHCPLGLAGHMHSPKDVRRHLKCSPSCSHYTKVRFQLDLFQVSCVKHSSCCMDWPDSLDTQEKDLQLMPSVCFYKEPHQPQTLSQPASISNQKKNLEPKSPRGKRSCLAPSWLCSAPGVWQTHPCRAFLWLWIVLA